MCIEILNVLTTFCSPTCIQNYDLVWCHGCARALTGRIHNLLSRQTSSVLAHTHTRTCSLQLNVTRWSAVERVFCSRAVAFRAFRPRSACPLTAHTPSVRTLASTAAPDQVNVVHCQCRCSCRSSLFFT